jgi:hypothetical protein
MNAEKELIEERRATLAELMRTLPKRMLDVSIERGRQYKRDYPRAEKMIKQANPDVHELQKMINLLR